MKDKSASYTVKKRSDYKAPDFTAIKTELTFVLDDTSTVVTNTTLYRRLSPNKSLPLRLDGEMLKLNYVRLDKADCKYAVKGNILEIEDVPDEFTLEIETVINPSENTSLMGLYKYNGCYCTQCEPEGFRRITYFLDRSDVLSTYKVTIVGPEFGCGVLLSNGNLIEEGNKKGRPYAIFEDPFPKPSYLFALVAGSFDILNDTYTTISGKKVDISLYVDRGYYDRGTWALSCIKEAMAWDEKRFGLEYDLKRFSVVAVDFFNFGAMENKSLNVFNSMYVLVDPAVATDNEFYNVQSVIGHEYFHNYTGDRVTLRDWFQLSLKESLTVFRDQEFSSDRANRALTRLKAINVIRSAQFAEDASPMAHPVRPEEVMEMNNFYTVTIYDKGAEIIRMIHTLIGEERFKKALQFYLEKFDGKAATIEDFLCCFEESANIDLQQFRRWYTQAGTPRVKASWQYADGQMHLCLAQHTPKTLGQEKKEPFYIPVRLSFMDQKGHKVRPYELKTDDFVVLKEETQEFVYSVGEDVLPVILEDFSAPVKLEAPYTEEDLLRLIAYCDDPFIKVDAATRLQRANVEANMLNASDSQNFVEPVALIKAYDRLFEKFDGTTDLVALCAALTIQDLQFFMETFDVIEDVDRLYRCREHLMETVAVALDSRFLHIFNTINPTTHEYSVDNMQKRMLKNLALKMHATALKVKGNTNEASDFVYKYYRHSFNMTDTLESMQDAVHMGLECSKDILIDFEKKHQNDPLVFNNFFRVQSSVANHNAIDNVKRLLSHPAYDIKNPNRVRALVGTLALSNPVALHDISGDGYTLLKAEIVRLNTINENVAARLVTPLLSFRRFDAKRQELILNELQSIMKMPNVCRSIYEKVSQALKEQ